jgi:hypothetical protein
MLLLTLMQNRIRRDGRPTQARCSIELRNSNAGQGVAAAGYCGHTERTPFLSQRLANITFSLPASLLPS